MAAIPDRVAELERDRDTLAAQVGTVTELEAKHDAAIAALTELTTDRDDGLADELAALRGDVRRLEAAFRDLSTALEDAGALARRAAT